LVQLQQEELDAAEMEDQWGGEGDEDDWEGLEAGFRV